MTGTIVILPSDPLFSAARLEPDAVLTATGAIVLPREERSDPSQGLRP